MQSLRIPYYELSPELTSALRSVGQLLEQSSLGLRFIELLYLRISQINGCEFCLRLHGRKLLETGESEIRISQLENWRQSELFDRREQVALTWAESLTNITVTHASDEYFEPLKSQFSDLEITELTFAIVTMNALNRLAIGMQRVV